MNDSPSPASRPFLTRLARFVLIAAAAFLVLCGVAAVGVPLLIGQVVLPRASESIGRQITVERLRFNPFKLILSARGIRIGDGDAGADFVTVQEVVADLSLSSLRHLAPVVESVKVTRPVVDLYRREDGRFNFSDILERLQRPTAEPPGETMRFALQDLEVSGGEIRLDDRLLQQKHRINELQIGILAVSNLEDANSATVRPSVSALVNGSAFRLTGVSMPFSESAETTLDATLQDLDIATYLPLAPVELAVVVPKGRLSTELKLQFARQAGVGVLGISGTADVVDLQIDAKAGGRLVSAKGIRLGLDRVEALSGRYELGDLAVDGLDVEVERRPDGTLALLDALTPRPSRRTSAAVKAPAEKAPAEKPAEKAPAEKPPEKAPGEKPAAEEIRWSLRATKLEGGRVGYRDRSVSPAVQLIHTAVALELGEIGNRQAQPAPGKLSLRQNDSSSLSWGGQVDVANSRAGGRLNAKVAALAPYLPYLAGAVNAGLQSGTLAAEGDVKLGWARDLTLEVANAQASVDNARLTLPDDAKPAVVLGRIAAHGIAASLAGRLAEVARLEISGGDIRVERAADGKINLQRISTQSAPDDGARKEDKSSPAWTVRVARVDLDRNAIDWRDLSAPQPVSLPVSNLSGTIAQVGTDLSRPSQVDLKARLGESGEVTARGNLVPSPLSMQLDVQLQKLGLAAFDPYVSRKLALGIDEGVVSTGGKLGYE
ncbi:MAG TPA: DUF748 domain-containing protein, partial [Lautropia sp.]|nr:DUF748 domain-containing protein [Lautropia sp.]